MNPSNSKAQKEAEDFVLKKIGLESRKIEIDGVNFNFDGFSKENKEIVEIYAGIEILKPAQRQKVSQDILKMILFEKLSGKKYSKRFIVINKEIYKKLKSEKSWKNRAFDIFEIKLEYIEIDEQIYKKIKEAKNNQNLLNQKVNN